MEKDEGTKGISNVPVETEWQRLWGKINSKFKIQTPVDAVDDTGRREVGRDFQLDDARGKN